ncbi:alpha-keto acid decarboxylase family protein [Rhodoblastus acidophilus]|uniref:Alpha-keto acid decarboxylase family protein n=1 Tax=Candidatus Rhodoblastus alkanivorans TaxID=2954117 RepID=A0ABS9Z4W7_9HYPH|nr:thiamine pyrophosphate-binding protein [Candidatus Rhodoblastus alkanivorans]MCI4679878.1 alpha-keto acid decarboxylase family protein [Candidatus Rhodoblastus alkanivorans]MCI4682719.1 alpha-keto acid decarboxylase family protein [Candidatus Rhodoblastus alkanivorans]MDI4640026.1 alpha-keto acid decarboxylase family protein [Rhodoblastus acidophilus]
MATSVIQYVLRRLRDIGVTDVFGVPGDYAFPVNDAICNEPGLRWIGCCNELSAAYAAEGYARIRGVGALCTTYGVGELSAINGVAGAYAEHLPVFHLVGAPNVAIQESRALMHHTLGNGEYDLFRRMSEPVVCAHAVMTPQNVAYETERLIAEALYHLRPVYMVFPADLASAPVAGEARAIASPQSDPDALAHVSEVIVEAIDKARSACVLPGVLIARAGLQPALHELIAVSGLPFATMFMDKSVLDETHPCYVGMYDGALMQPEVRAFVEEADQVLAIGTLMTDFNTGAFTSRLDPARTISIGKHRVRVGDKTFFNAELGDLLKSLTSRLSRRDWPKIAPKRLGKATGAGDDKIDAAALYPRLAGFLRENDILFAETGTTSMGLGFAQMPSGANFYNQTLWGSIGWATPAAFGASIAAPERRVVLLTGDGAHQFTVQEISQFARYGRKPIVFVVNNSGYLIERLLCREPGIAYNDIAPWRYSLLPQAFGCDGWFSARVETCAEFDQALEAASHAETGVYIEIVTDAYAASDLATKMHQTFRKLYE